jgi:hypothetical protein
VDFIALVVKSNLRESISVIKGFVENLPDYHCVLCFLALRCFFCIQGTDQKIRCFISYLEFKRDHCLVTHAQEYSEVNLCTVFISTL